MPLTKPFLDMVNIDRVILDSGETEGKLVAFDNEFYLKNKKASETYAKISDITFDSQQGVLTVLFSNNMSLKAHGFPNTFKIDGGKPGIDGDKGDKGDDGRDGRDGVNGIQGCQGDAGSEGNRGDKGQVGDRGPQGERGDTGNIGDIGEQGPRGERGEIGARGDRGPRGLDGKDGWVNIVISDIDPGDSIGPYGLWVVPE